MRVLNARYNEQENAIEILDYGTGYILRLNCNKWEAELMITPNSQRYLDTLAIDNPMEYVRLALSGEMQIWLDAMDE